jgi:hypothetical protein
MFAFRKCLADAEDHVATLRTAILRADFAESKEQIVSLRSSLVTTLAGKAMLHSLLGLHHFESRRMALESVRHMSQATEMVREDELHFMDPVTGVSTCDLLQCIIPDVEVEPCPDHPRILDDPSVQRTQDCPGESDERSHQRSLDHTGCYRVVPSVPGPRDETCTSTSPIFGSRI